MAASSGQKLGHRPTRDDEIDGGGRRNSSTEHILLWISRLGYPLATCLLGQAIYWLWLDGLPTADRLGNLVSGLSLSVAIVPVFISGLLSWCFSET